MRHSVKCAATTKSGKRCRNAARQRSSYCGVHAALGSKARSAHESGPTRGKGSALAAARGGMRAGASDAREAARRLVPQARQKISQAVYATCYYVSYGVVFGTVYLARKVPSDNAMGHGLRDGARAAYRHALRLEEQRARPAPPAPAPQPA